MQKPYLKYHPTRSRMLKFLCLSFLFVWQSASADWPCHLGDSHRSGVSKDKLQFPLKPLWEYKPLNPPQPAWPEMPAQNDYWHKVHGLNPTNTYDRAFNTIIVGENLYYGSSTDDAVHCLDISTGENKWSFFTEGPIRLAPVFYNDKLYAGSDDGCLYCLDSQSGKLVWKYRPDTDTRVIGNGRMISSLPIRSGIIVDEGTVYFTAGLLPNTGVYVCAVNADTGQQIYKQKTDISAQGYMLATPTRLFVPTGRTAPQVFDRATGNKQGPFGAGGSFAVVLDDMLVSGPDERGNITINDPTSRERIVSTQGLRIIADGPMAYILTKDNLSALDRQNYVNLSTQIAQIEKIKPDKRTDEQKNQLVQLRLQRQKCLKWQVPCSAPYSLIMASDVLIAGGENNIFAFSAADGKQIWTSPVNGKAYDLAVSGGKLIASTDEGTIHCFSNSTSPSRLVRQEPKPLTARKDHLTKLYSDAVEKALDSCPDKKGYCLVLGADTGRLAHEIITNSDFNVIAVESDHAKAAEARKLLLPTGQYGTRITVHNLQLDKLPYPDMFANLIVSDEIIRTGKISSPPEQLYRMLRPCGGTLALAQPRAILNKTELKDWAGDSIPELKTKNAPRFIFASVQRPKLSGQGEWTHTYADPANTACSKDQLVKSPLRLQWFGKPGPREMIDRHHRNVPPLYKNGRVFIPGDNVVFAVDAYNGTIQWEARIPKSRRLGVFLDTSNIVVDDEHLYIAAEDKCFAFDVSTGQMVKTFTMPQLIKGTDCQWSYLASIDGILYASARLKEASYTQTSWEADNALWYQNMKVVTSRYFFAIDPKIQKVLWTFKPEVALNPTITVADGKMFFIETTNPAALQDTLGRMPIKNLFEAGDQNLIALDIKTGDTVYTQKIDTTNFKEPVFLNFANNILLLSGSKLIDGNIIYHVDAFDATTGKIVWNITHNSELPKDGGHGEYNRHPTIVGDTAYIWPYAYNITTGQKIEGWKFDRRGHGCGGVSASANALFWRGNNPWMYDFSPNAGAIRLSQITRPGCWINIIPAGGMVLIPEASSGCTCGYPLQTSMAFAPVSEDQTL